MGWESGVGGHIDADETNPARLLIVKVAIARANESAASCRNRVQEPDVHTVALSSSQGSTKGNRSAGAAAWPSGAVSRVRIAAQQNGKSFIRVFLQVSVQ